MVELVYPESPAPLLPGSEAARASEMLPVTDIQGNVLFQVSRSYCHSGARPLHPVVHLHIIDRTGRIYLQRRAASKDLFPLYWDTSVGGHVSYGEYVIEALARETSEELGIVDFNPVFMESYIWESDNERELVNSFAAVGSLEPMPDAAELDCGRWWSFQDILQSRDSFTPNFMKEFLRLKDSLTALL